MRTIKLRLFGEPNGMGPVRLNMKKLIAKIGLLLGGMLVLVAGCRPKPISWAAVSGSIPSRERGRALWWME